MGKAVVGSGGKRATRSEAEDGASEVLTSAAGALATKSVGSVDISLTTLFTPLIFLLVSRIYYRYIILSLLSSLLIEPTRYGGFCCLPELYYIA